MRELGIGVTAYRVLGNGLIPGRPATGRHRRAGRAWAPSRADDEQRNRDIIDAVRKIAAQSGISVAQLAIAWTLSRGQDIVPLIGVRTRERLSEALGALAVMLSESDLAAIDRITSPAGE